MTATSSRPGPWDEYTSAVPYGFGEEIGFSLAGVEVTVRTDFKKIR